MRKPFKKTASERLNYNGKHFCSENNQNLNVEDKSKYFMKIIQPLV